ncbi:MAG: hypothetical protein QM594_11265 [Niabella sp.]
MKKIFILSTICSFLFLQSCTKEELVTVNEPLELDENSKQFQTYLAERAINFIKLYRFDKLGNTIDRITDPTIREEVTALYKEYRKRASEEALFYVTPANDTLYFIPSISGRPEAQTALSINFTPIIFDAQNQRNLINTKGTLQGFAIFPNMESVGFMNPLATGLKDMDKMPKLKVFSIDKMLDFMEAAYPNEDVRTPTKLEADFSKNSNLERLTLNYTDISNVKFPAHKLTDYFDVTYGIVNNSLSNVNANKMILRYSSSADPDLVLSGSINQLELTDISGVKKLNLKNVKDLQLISLKLRDIEELTLPDGITNEILTDSRSISSWTEPLWLKQGCIIHNAPAGIEEHVYYYQ